MGYLYYYQHLLDVEYCGCQRNSSHRNVMHCVVDLFCCAMLFGSPQSWTALHCTASHCIAFYYCLLVKADVCVKCWLLFLLRAPLISPELLNIHSPILYAYIFLCSVRADQEKVTTGNSCCQRFVYVRQSIVLLLIFFFGCIFNFRDSLTCFF